ncbi:MAG TPA: PDZ domain-containing protein [Vicinamibacterales bacterium]|nr:PDZ domain-containing protein [Vicinamibacterales bacterium]
MAGKKSTIFYSMMIALSSLVVGMVLASRLGLAPISSAGPLDIPKTNSAPLNGPIDAATFRNIAHEASPTVVSIRTKSQRQAGSGGLEELFGLQPRVMPGRPGRSQGQQAPQLVMGAGSGFVIDKAGYILTNNHVIEGATEIEVWLAGMDDLGRGLTAKIVGTDILTDSALLQLTEMPEQPLTASKFGDSSQIAPGDWVMAIGNPFTLSNSVTVGVVSAVGRQQQTAIPNRSSEMIQTDAAINRGNSGGPLLNVRGEVVGINTQIVSDGGGNLGIGFAMPINTIRNILPQLMKGKVTRGRIGVYVDRIPMTKSDLEEFGLAGQTGALVKEIQEGPAKKAGMHIGDVILEFNGKPVKNSDDLVSMVSATAPGSTVPVKVMRAKKPVTLNVTIEELNVDTERDDPLAQVPAPKVEEPKDTAFGMSVEALTPNRARRMNLPNGMGGAIVSDVEPAGPAARAGIGPNDVITEVNGTKVTSVDQVTKALEAVGDGRTARIVIFRDGREVLALVRKR